MGSLGGASSWQLTGGQREQLIERIKECYSSLLFIKGNTVSDERVDLISRGVEKQAYMTAQVESRTTTGDRPAEEIMKAYVRKLSQQVMEALQSGDSQGGLENGHAHNKPQFTVDKNGRFDVSGMKTRGFIDHDDAQDLFKPLMQKNNQVRSIKFSDRSFDVGAAEVAAKALMNCADTLEEADLSDIVAGRPEDVALDVYEIFSDSLVKCKKLIKLDLSDNAMGEKGFRQFKSILQAQSNLQELQVRNIGCSPETCAAISELVSSNKLKSLIMINNMSGDDGAIALEPLIKRNPQLTTFVMNSGRVQEAGCQAILKSLSKCTQLTRFELGDNSLTEDSAGELLEFLNSHEKLQQVNLSYALLGNDGISSIVQCIEGGGLKELKEIQIKGEDYSEAGDEFLKLFAVLASCENLEILDIGENMFENKGIILFCKALEKFKGPLKILKLDNNQIGRLGAVAITKCAVELYQNKGEFQKLILNENQISEDGIQQIEQILLDAGLNKEFISFENNEPEDDDEDEVDDDLDLDASGHQLAQQLEKLGIK